MKIVVKKLTLSILLLSTLLFINPAWAEVKAFLNQDTFFEGDPITLTIEANTNTQAGPDLSVLNQDFEVLGKSTSTQINILNGHKRIKKSWTIELQPRKKGAIQIPAIMLGQERTNPLSLTITDIPPELEKQTSEHVFVESSVDIVDERPYVQQQIPYTVRLYYDSAMQTGKIYSPTVKDAVVEQLGEDRRYRTVRKGKKYSVIEKHFVISPEKSGKLHIPPTSVKGRLTIADKRNRRQNGQRRDETDFMNQFFSNSPFSNDPFFKDFGGGFFSNRGAASNPFTANSEAIDVEVQPLPAEFKGKLWLPAEELIIKDSWAKKPPELRVGEPVTRTLILQAKGLAGSQIPDIEIPKPADVRLYPEQSKPETRTDGKTVYGIKEINLSYIPDVSGAIIIPKIKLDWWNVVSKKQQTFTLPEWTLNVAPAIAGASDKKATTTDVATANEKSVLEKDQAKFTDFVTENTSGSDSFGWKLVAIAGLLIILIYSFFHFIYKRKATSVKSKEIDVTIDEIINSLRHVCEKNDKKQAAKLLLDLAAVSWGGQNPPRNLATLASEVEYGSDEILLLERALYAGDSKKGDDQKEWNGASLWKVVKKGIKPKSVKSEIIKNDLKPLYPV